MADDYYYYEYFFMTFNLRFRARLSRLQPHLGFEISRRDALLIFSTAE